MNLLVEIMGFTKMNSMNLRNHKTTLETPRKWLVSTRLGCNVTTNILGEL